MTMVRVVEGDLEGGLIVAVIEQSVQRGPPRVAISVSELTVPFDRLKLRSGVGAQALGSEDQRVREVDVHRLAGALKQSLPADVRIRAAEGLPDPIEL